MTEDRLMTDLRRTLRRQRIITLLASALGTFIGMIISVLVIYVCVIIIINHPFR